MIDISAYRNYICVYTLKDQIMKRIQIKGLLIVLTMIMISAVAVTAQNTNTLKGKISDNTNKPLGNVNILVKGTAQGAKTGPDGTFELQTASDEITLLVSDLGFEKQEISIDFKNNKMVTIQINRT